ncbi:hypothetical protein ACICHK_40130 [Streptomyces sp. AHU1]|uniref:hypothetical protein n=1 Tax=Streptomyces sp. AHU1 TaxID=3377215 RepID=UPI0038780355
MTVNETVIALIRPKPNLDLVAGEPPEAFAAAQAAAPAPEGIGTLDSYAIEVGRPLREAQRLLTVGEVRASIPEARRALEWVRENDGWENPESKKLGSRCTQTERWWRIQDALYSQTSGALHNDAFTKTFKYDRPRRRLCWR